MAEKRMLILPAELVKKVDENRGDMSQAEFIDYLITSQLKEESKAEKKYVTEEQFHSFEQDVKKLLKSFLDFFINYDLELGNKSPRTELEALVSRLQGLDKEPDSDSDKKATIKWK